MKRLVAFTLSLFIIALAAAALSVAPPALADPSGICPDGFMLLYAPGDRHDKNGNGFVCRKLQNGRVSGGPDDSIDDIII